MTKTRTKDTTIYESDPSLVSGSSLRAARLDDGRLRLNVGYPVTIGGAPITKQEVCVVLDAAQEDALLSALAVKQVGADPTWTVLGIWDNDEAVPVGAILGTHSVHGDPPGERAWRELANDPNFFGFDTSSFYEQGVWAETVTASDGDTAQDLAVEAMMRAQHEDDDEGESDDENEENKA